jgi:acyl-CoA reductase-like NAD-dependent aldehyde dehydrogenase
MMVAKLIQQALDEFDAVGVFNLLTAPERTYPAMTMHRDVGLIGFTGNRPLERRSAQPVKRTMWSWRNGPHRLRRRHPTAA